VEQASCLLLYLPLVCHLTSPRSRDFSDISISFPIILSLVRKVSGSRRDFIPYQSIYRQLTYCIIPLSNVSRPYTLMLSQNQRSVLINPFWVSLGSEMLDTVKIRRKTRVYAIQFGGRARQVPIRTDVLPLKAHI
jgi:hypothetical protein